MFLNCICILYKEAAYIPDASIGVFHRDYITRRVNNNGNRKR